ncbi:o-succinylbenzoate synthase [candidate division KSB1 bacterium]|nr:o-succinylbenzoate synthase [candidate division KSB1 bacterium]
MIYTHFHIYSYSLPFTRPIHSMNQILTNRNGLLIQLQIDAGLSAFGDVPPFPGLSNESIDMAVKQLAAAGRKLVGHTVNETKSSHPLELLAELETILAPEERLYPGVAFGIESVVLDVLAQAAGVTIAELLARSPHFQVKTNGLIVGDIKEIPARAQQLIDSGYTCLKIKVGRGDAAADIRMLRDMNDLIGPHIKIRLDANRAWTLKEAVHFARSIAALNIDYVEEPLQTPELLKDFAETGLAVALDESLDEKWLAQPPEGVVAFVLKPGINGGVLDTIRFIKKAQEHDVRPIISSAFLNAIGLKMAVMLAAAFTSPDEVMGLDTSSFLAADFCRLPVKIKNGILDVRELSQNIIIPDKLIDKVYSC